MKFRSSLLFALTIAASGCILDRKGGNPTAEFPENIDVVVFGEIHGTTESPLIFERYVEKMARLNATAVVVGLEIPPSALNEAKSAGAECAKVKACVKLLSESPFWAKSRDGRSSKAYFDLITELSKLELDGEIVLVGIDARQTGREAFGELVAQKVQPLLGSARAVLLTGNGHAHYDESPSGVPNALQKLNLRVASVILRPTGGTAWVCSGGRCGVQPVRQQACTFNLENMKLVRGAETDVCVGSLTASQPMVDFITGVTP